MTEKSASDVLRELLDERGVEWVKPNSALEFNQTTFLHDGWGVEVLERSIGLCVTASNLFDTPEQAIAATLGYETNPDGLPVGLTISDDGNLLNWRGENYIRQGSGTLTAEQVRNACEKHWHDLPAEYDMPEATALPEYSYDWQAIADELNATLGSDDEYEAKMDALLCHLTNGKFSKSRQYSLDFMKSCVDEEYEMLYAKELADATLGAQADYRGVDRLRGIADDMRNIGASSMTPHELFAYWAGEIEKAIGLLEYEQAATLGADERETVAPTAEMNWERLFGTPERAAETLGHMCQFTHGGEMCERCRLYLFNDCDTELRVFSDTKIERTMLEWLRGKAVE